MLALAKYRHRRRTAFWWLRPDGLAVAVLEPTTDEPLLLMCSDVATSSPANPNDFAPGLLETAADVRALDLVHVAALDRAYCRLADAKAATEREAASTEEVSVPVQGRPDLRVIASRVAITSAVRRFESARLQLVALDAAPCALLNLAQHLARTTRAELSGELADGADLDPLTAVSVTPDCESTAARLARVLGVPVGLALGRFGLIEHG